MTTALWVLVLILVVATALSLSGSKPWCGCGCSKEECRCDGGHCMACAGCELCKDRPRPTCNCEFCKKAK